MTLIASTEAQDFMKFQKDYDQNQANIIKKDDEWYYNDTTHVTNTHLGKIIEGGPQHLQKYYDFGQEDKEEYIFGRAAHCLLLEPETFGSRFYTIDDTEICIKASGENWKKENKNPRNTKYYIEQMGIIKSDGVDKQFIPLDSFNRINAMVKKAKSYKRIQDLLKLANKREIIYSNELLGVKTKCKVDAINPGHFIVDYKTDKNPATTANFQKTVRYNNLDRQAAYYMDTTNTKTFYWLVQEKTYPYTVGIFQASENTYDTGKMKYEQGLIDYKQKFLNKSTEDLNNYYESGII